MRSAQRRRFAAASLQARFSMRQRGPAALDQVVDGVYQEEGIPLRLRLQHGCERGRKSVRGEAAIEVLRHHGKVQTLERDGV